VPPDVTEAENYIKSLIEVPQFKNIMGRLLTAVAVPSFGKALNIAFGHKCRSEMLAMYLSQKLGENLVYNDPYTGKPYQLDANGVPFSVGPDRKAGTKDDIVLQPENK
jgi:hypothetical protein